MKHLGNILVIVGILGIIFGEFYYLSLPLVFFGFGYTEGYKEGKKKTKKYVLVPILCFLPGLILFLDETNRGAAVMLMGLGVGLAAGYSFGRMEETRQKNKKL